MRHIHFIGIGGVGMNGLAQLAVLSGFRVSGSDRAYDPDTEPYRALTRMGIRIIPQDGSGIHAGIDCMVYSTAIEAGNPDLSAARTLHIPGLHRAEFLQQLIGDNPLIAVAGTAGKTTTTGLLGWIFECLGKDPSVYNGAAVLNWKTDSRPGNIRKGKSRLWIIEADESDRSFLQFHPTHSIITNISRDHYELDELHAMFNQFESQTSGYTVRGRTDDVRPNGAAPLTCRTASMSAPSPAAMMGRHNRENAQCAYALCMELGFDPAAVAAAITRFKGIERRLETVGAANGITVIDDYAHNPAKIAAALSAVAESYEQVHAYWRPHGFTPLFQFREELVRVFNESPLTNLFILPVYYAGGTVDRKITAAEFTAQLKSTGVPACHVPDYRTLKAELERRARAGDAILGMGARDPELPRFARRLVDTWTTLRP